MNSINQTFHIDWKILITQAVNFGIVLTVLYLFALKPIKKLMDERSERIKKGVSDAKTNAELLSKTKKEYDSIVAKARIESNEIFQKGKVEAEKNKTKIIESTQIDVNNLINNGKKDLEREKLKMVDEAKKEIVSLVVRATEKLLLLNSNESFDKKTLDQIKKL